MKTENNKIFSESTFLDPRFKKYGFSDDKYLEATKKNIINYISSQTYCENENKKQDKECNNPPKKESTSKVWTDFDESNQYLFPMKIPK